MPRLQGETPADSQFTFTLPSRLWQVVGTYESCLPQRRQVVDLQSLVERLRASGSEENYLNRESNYGLLEKLQIEHLQNTMELKNQLEQVKVLASFL